MTPPHPVSSNACTPPEWCSPDFSTESSDDVAATDDMNSSTAKCTDVCAGFFLETDKESLVTYLVNSMGLLAKVFSEGNEKSYDPDLVPCALPGPVSACLLPVVGT